MTMGTPPRRRARRFWTPAAVFAAVVLIVLAVAVGPPEHSGGTCERSSTAQQSFPGNRSFAYTKWNECGGGTASVTVQTDVCKRRYPWDLIESDQC